MKIYRIKRFFFESLRKYMVMFLLILTTLQVSAQITVKIKDQTIRRTLEQIEQKSDYKFFFNDDFSDLNKRVTLNFDDVTIKAAMAELLKNTNLTYSLKENGKLVVLALKAQQDAVQAPQVSSKVSGIVSDARGVTLPGASIMDKGESNNVTTTDLDGRYTISIKKGASLEVSYIGYESQVVDPNGRAVLNIVLEEDSELLDEVVVIGYGTQKKVNLTGAISTIDLDDISARPTNNIISSLQGTVPGMMVTSRPNGQVDINIRGVGSTAGSSAPMFIVDGFEVSQSFFSKMDPNSIESISVLKDAASTAIYGAKAAYGIVLATTKSGGGRTTVTVSSHWGTQKPTYLPEFVSSLEYAELANIAAVNSGISMENMPFTSAEIEHYRLGDSPDLYPNTNWYDECYRDSAPFNKQTVGIQGGEKVKYYVGFGYNKFNDILPDSASSDYNITSRISSDLYPWLNIRANINYIYTDKQQNNGGVQLGRFFDASPLSVGQHSDGTWGSIRNGRDVTASDAQRNPLRTLMEGGRTENANSELYASGGVTIKPIKGLNIVNNVGLKHRDYSNMTFTNSLTPLVSFITKEEIPATGTPQNKMNRTFGNNISFMYDGFIDYERTINSDHTIKGLVGLHYESSDSEAYEISRTNFLSNDMNDFNGGSTNPGDQGVTKGSINENALFSYFARINYSYKDRYLFEANIRRDASSRFPSDKRWGTFPSMSGAWRLDKEPFLKNATWIDLLKIRGSWGRAGNINNIGNYDYYPAYVNSTSTIVMGGELYSIINQSKLANSDLTWEKTQSSDVGLDFSMKNGLLTASVDYYRRVTSDILIAQNDVSSETGINPDILPAKNIGKVLNAGVELSVSHNYQINNNLSYSISGSISYNKNEILELGGVDELPPEVYHMSTINRVGYPINSFYQIEADGLYSTADKENGLILPYGSHYPEPGAIKLVDANGDGIISDADRVMSGNQMPDITYGVNLSLSYKGLTLAVQGQGIAGADRYNWGASSWMFYLNSTPQTWMLNYWTPENQASATYPRPNWSNVSPDAEYNVRTSSFWMFDGDYFRIKNITLSWEMPNKWFGNVLQGVRLYATGDNLFTIRGDKLTEGLDPESGSGGDSSGQIFKSVSGGITITF